jgi:tyrosyl-tRNA synthetase
MSTTLEKEIDNLLARGVGEFIDPDGAFKKKLVLKAQGKYPKPLYIKFGVDPTRPDLHLGHAVVLRKLRKFQDYGATVIFLIGDITAQIGDPTGKSKVRPEIDQKMIEENMATYLAQVGKILKTDATVFSLDSKFRMVFRCC